MSYASWSVIAGEQPTTSKWNILGTNDSAFNDGTGFAWGSSAVLTGGPAASTWTPTWTNFTVGNGTLSYARYIQVGKRVTATWKFILGTTSSASGNISLSLPLTAQVAVPAAFTTAGRGRYFDSS